MWVKKTPVVSLAPQTATATSETLRLRKWSGAVKQQAITESLLFTQIYASMATRMSSLGHRGLNIMYILTRMSLVFSKYNSDQRLWIYFHPTSPMVGLLSQFPPFRNFSHFFLFRATRGNFSMGGVNSENLEKEAIFHAWIRKILKIFACIYLNLVLHWVICCSYMYLSFNHTLEVMKNATYIENVFSMIQLLSFSNKGYFISYIAKIQMRFAHFFFVDNPLKRCVFKPGYDHGIVLDIGILIFMLTIGGNFSLDIPICPPLPTPW